MVRILGALYSAWLIASRILADRSRSPYPRRMRTKVVIGAFALVFVACGCGSSSDGGAPADTGPSSDAASDGGGRVCDPASPSVCDGATSVKTCRTDGTGYDTLPCTGGAACKSGVCGCVPKSG